MPLPADFDEVQFSDPVLIMIEALRSHFPASIPIVAQLGPRGMPDVDYAIVVRNRGHFDPFEVDHRFLMRSRLGIDCLAQSGGDGRGDSMKMAMRAREVALMLDRGTFVPSGAYQPAVRANLEHVSACTILEEPATAQGWNLGSGGVSLPTDVWRSALTVMIQQRTKMETE